MLDRETVAVTRPPNNPLFPPTRFTVPHLYINTKVCLKEGTETHPFVELEEEEDGYLLNYCNGWAKCIKEEEGLGTGTRRTGERKEWQRAENEEEEEGD